LDHIVILVPYSYLSGLPGLDKPSTATTSAGTDSQGGSGSSGGDGGAPSWFRELFTFSPGGRHADGVTENVLVLFGDGVYLEFIAFTPEAGAAGSRGRQGHKWGAFEEGSVVDWAVTVFHGAGGEGKGGAQRNYDRFVKPITDKILRGHGGKQDEAAAVVYGALTPGGRTRPDGVVLEWATVPAVQVCRSAAPPARTGSSSGAAGGGGDWRQTEQEPVRPGLAPFWCLDETPRERRVPYLQGAAKTSAAAAAAAEVGRGAGENAATEHRNSGAVGVAGVKVTSVPGVSVDGLGRLFGEVFGGAGDNGEEEKKGWPLRAPEGTRYHPDGRLEIAEVKVKEGGSGVDGEKSVVVSLYTDKPELVGKQIGGQVDGKRGIWFELVGV